MKRNLIHCVELAGKVGASTHVLCGLTLGHSDVGGNDDLFWGLKWLSTFTITFSWKWQRSVKSFTQVLTSHSWRKWDIHLVQGQVGQYRYRLQPDPTWSVYIILILCIKCQIYSPSEQRQLTAFWLYCGSLGKIYSEFKNVRGIKGRQCG